GASGLVSVSTFTNLRKIRKRARGVPHAPCRRTQLPHGVRDLSLSCSGLLLLLFCHRSPPAAALGSLPACGAARPAGTP
ncbi:MAG: hypothetical protein AAF840_11715, partial [Bacteroidota bacterium]